MQQKIFYKKKAIGKLLNKCRFTTEYFNYESGQMQTYNCDSENLDVLESGLCIFHEKRYLEGYLFQDQFGPKEVSKLTATQEVLRAQRVTKRLMKK